MKLSAPVYILKQQAKALARELKIPLHRALDRIANREGFKTWSLLASKLAAEQPAAELMAQLRPGDLVLLGARPGQGKTLLSLELALLNRRRGRHAAFFTLCWTKTEVAARVAALSDAERGDGWLVDDSDDICADYIVGKLAAAAPGTLVVIDYLQLLDRNRAHPDLMSQVQRLKRFAADRQSIVVCLSQIRRSYDAATRSHPEISDVLLPNPLDLTLFDRACFMGRRKQQIVSHA
jgi:replicative DNA helicase